MVDSAEGQGAAKGEADKGAQQDQGGKDGAKAAGKDGGKLSGEDIDAATNLLGADDWRSDLPEDLKKPAERFASKADAVRAIVAFQKRDGQIRVPGKNATDEEKAAYRKAIGIPEKADGYEFPELAEGQLTDEIKASRSEWSKRFFDLGVPKDMANALIKMVSEDGEKHLKAQIDADKAFAKKQQEILKSEWKGDDYDKNIILANRAFSEIANRAGISVDALKTIETKDGRFLMDRAEMLKLFSVIGREMAEGTLGPALSEDERETLDDQIRDVRKQINEAQTNKDSKLANLLYKKEQALIAKSKGSKPIVGSQGRAA